MSDPYWRTVMSRINVNGRVISAYFWVIVVAIVCALSVHSAPGDLDQTFSFDGIVTGGIGSSFNRARGSALQTDGKIVVAGLADQNFAVLRYNADGSLDLSFDEDGMLTTYFGAPQNEALAVAIQPDGKIVAVGFMRIGVNDDFAIARYNSNGTLDTTFDVDGLVTTAIGTGNDVATSIAIQSDGKIVVGGYYRATNDDFAVVRYNTNGSLDTTFGAGGKALTPISTSGNDQANAVALQSDGKIIAAGTTGSTFGVARFNTDGSLDTTFSTDGKQTVATTTSANAVQLQSDGKIVLAGRSTSAVVVARLDTSGNLDTTFDTDGRVSTTVGLSTSSAEVVLIQPTGQILIGGRASISGTGNDFLAVQYNPNGSLDNSFDGDGILTVALAPGNISEVAETGVLQPDGNVVLAGNTDTDIGLIRFGTGGNLDTTFDSDGIVSTDEIAGSSYFYDSAIQADGKILVAGRTERPDLGYDDTLVRLNANGTKDLSFGVGGSVKLNSGNLSAIGKPSVAVQSDGKILIAGDGDTGPTSSELFVARLNADGSFDPTFDSDGIVTISIGTSYHTVQSVRVRPDGKIVLGGTFVDTLVSTIDRSIIVRYNADGSLDTTFDTDGHVVVQGDYELRAMAIQPDGKVVIAGDLNYVNGNTDFAVLRYNENGALDASFNSDGIYTTSFAASGFEAADSVAIHPNGKIVAAGSFPVGLFKDSAILRLDLNGNEDPSFDVDGKATTAVSADQDGIISIAIQWDGKVVGTGVARIGANNEFFAIRYNYDGSLDSSAFTSDESHLFGTGGIAIPKMGNNCFGYSVAIQPDNKIVLTGQADGTLAIARLVGDLAPTASNVSVSGRVTSSGGHGLRGATVTLTSSSGQAQTVLTSSFGYFRFDDIDVGSSVIVSVNSKRYEFPSQVITVGDEITDLVFVPVSTVSVYQRPHFSLSRRTSK